MKYKIKEEIPEWRLKNGNEEQILRQFACKFVEGLPISVVKKLFNLKFVRPKDEEYEYIKPTYPEILLQERELFFITGEIEADESKNIFEEN